MNIFLSYVSVLIPLVILDLIWLMFLAKDFYLEKMGFLFSKTINIYPIIVFYPIYSIGILFLAVLPALSSGNYLEALWRGALLGFVAYSAYDLTNHATISNWPLSMTILDIIWGVFVTATVSVSAYFIIRLIQG